MKKIIVAIIAAAMMLSLLAVPVMAEEVINVASYTEVFTPVNESDGQLGVSFIHRGENLGIARHIDDFIGHDRNGQQAEHHGGSDNRNNNLLHFEFLLYCQVLTPGR